MDLEQIKSGLEQIHKDLLVVPMIYTVLGCIVAGAVLRRGKFFNNERIPAALSLIGCLAYIGLSYKLDQDYRSQMWLENAVLGGALGLASVGIHQLIAKSPLLSSFPILKLLVPAPEAESKPTEEPKP